MLEFIRRLTERNRLERVRHLLARFVLPDPPPDPYVAVRQPRSHGPGGRNSAAAVDEPGEPLSTAAVGSATRTRP